MCSLSKAAPSPRQKKGKKKQTNKKIGKRGSLPGYSLGVQALRTLLLNSKKNDQSVSVR